MLGALDPSRKDVTVVGAGIAGLLVAYHLDRAGYEVTLLEAEERAGGLIQTTPTPEGLSESAAHSLLLTPECEELFSELGVKVFEVHNRRRYILRKGVLRRFPLTLWEALGAFFRAYLALADRRVAPEQLTVEQWGMKFLGEAATRCLLAPFVHGVYGVGPADLCVGAAFPSLQVPHGHSLLSIQMRKWIRGRKSRSRMVAPAEGMESVVLKLDSVLRTRLGTRYRLGERVSRLPTAGNIVLCVPAPVAGELLAADSAELRIALKSVAYTPLVSATAFVAREDLARPVEGIGVLFAEGENRKSLGILFNSSSFDGRVIDESRTASFTVILGGPRSEQLGLSDAAIQELVSSELREVLGARKVSSVRIHRWPRAVPRYDARLMEIWDLARKTWCSRPGRLLFSNYTGQVSLRGMIQAARSCPGAASI